MADPSRSFPGAASAIFAGLSLLLVVRFIFLRPWPFASTGTALDLAISAAAVAAFLLLSRKLAARAAPGDPSVATAAQMHAATGVITRVAIGLFLLLVVLLLLIMKGGFRL